LQSRGGDRAQRDPDAGEGDPAMGRAVVKDFGHAGVLDRLLMYERRIEHSLYRTMAELQRLRLLRETDRRAEDPTPEAKRRAIPEPATATEKRTSEPAGDGPDSPRQTKPIPESQCSGRPGPATQSPPPRETTPDHAKQTRFPGPLGRKPGADCVKQSQFAASRTRANSCLRSGLRQEGRRVAPRKQTQFAGLGWPLGGTCDGQGRQ